MVYLQVRQHFKRLLNVFLNDYFHLRRTNSNTCGKSKEEDNVDKKKPQDIAEDHLQKQRRDTQKKASGMWAFAVVLTCDAARTRVWLYLLYHDTVDAHVPVAPGEVEQVHPTQGETQHHDAQVLLLPEQIQPSWDQEEGALH